VSSRHVGVTRVVDSASSCTTMYVTSTPHLGGLVQALRCTVEETDHVAFHAESLCVERKLGWVRVSLGGPPAILKPALMTGTGDSDLIRA
jgi:hypothetical protein